VVVSYRATVFWSTRKS